MPQLPRDCPICGGTLALTEAACHQCGTELRGSFERNRFARLDPSQAEFLRLFAVSRGNMRQVGKRLGVSYPSVRARLEEVIATLQGEDGEP